MCGLCVTSTYGWNDDFAYTYVCSLLESIDKYQVFCIKYVWKANQNFSTDSMFWFLSKGNVLWFWVYRDDADGKSRFG